jgi:hypothetical protein
MKKRYTIRGNVIPLLRPRMYRGQLYDEYAHNKSLWLADLADQHGKDRPFMGPITVSARFELPYPALSSESTRTKLRGCHVTIFPSIGDLAKLLGELSTGILFNTDVIVVAMDVQKIFADNCLTCFTVSEIHNEKEKQREK